jgi:hypothetical protein
MDLAPPVALILLLRQVPIPLTDALHLTQLDAMMVSAPKLSPLVLIHWSTQDVQGKLHTNALLALVLFRVYNVHLCILVLRDKLVAVTVPADL